MAHLPCIGGKLGRLPVKRRMRVRPSAHVKVMDRHLLSVAAISVLGRMRMQLHERKSKSIGREVGRQAGMLTCRQTGRQAVGHVNRQADRVTGNGAGRGQWGTSTDRQTGWQAMGQVSRQIGGQAIRHAAWEWQLHTLAAE